VSELSPESWELIEHSRHAGGPTAAQRAAMKHAIVAAVLIPSAAAASTAGAVKAAGLSVATKLGLVVAAVSVGGWVTWQVMASSAEPILVPLPVVTAALEPPVVREEPVVVAMPEEIAEVISPPAPAPVVIAKPAVKPLVVVAAVEPEVRPAPPAPVLVPTEKEVEATLAKEVAALAGAMGAVDGKQFAVALEQVSGYREAFPKGLLETEAGVLEVLALCGLKRVDEAREAARSLPVNNPAVRRLERSCIRPSGK